MDTSVLNNWLVVITIAVVWGLCWKSAVLWKASQHIWFAILLVLNTAGFVSITYLVTHWNTESLKNRGKYETSVSLL